jgi:1-acyl-sn-glycerol-3-phosphate acyltransferase
MSNLQLAAVVVPIVLVLGLLWLVRIRHRSYTIPQLLLWYTAKLLVRFLWGAEQPKRWPIPQGQGAIVVCNHRSSVDPFFIQTMADRPIRWMVAREYCQHRLLGIFLRTCEVIPVGRGGIDTAATKIALRCASAGGLVGMLPEGRINKSDQFMLPVRPGAVMIALRARVPILPCYIEGSPYDGNSVTSPLFTRARVRVVLGELFDLSPYYGRESEEGLAGELTLQIVRQIARLAGLEDFEPTLAGRQWKPREEELNEP